MPVVIWERLLSNHPTPGEPEGTAAGSPSPPITMAEAAKLVSLYGSHIFFVIEDVQWALGLHQLGEYDKCFLIAFMHAAILLG